MKILQLTITLFLIMLISCRPKGTTSLSDKNSQDRTDIRLITLDPGHFHAALVQKIMYENVSPSVHVYAPAGPDIQQHLERIKSYNNRSESPTSWNEIVYTGTDFFEKMLAEKPGNVVVLSGNNMKKAEYIIRSVNAGLNVLSDKPMIIYPEDFPKLQEAFNVASAKKLLLYDLMTERYEITTIMQKELSQTEEIFGKIQTGSEKEPAVIKESVHHFSKTVSGKPLLRPAWFFDVKQQGEGIVDVTTHLVDLVQWECFPDQILSTNDIHVLSARRWPTPITGEEFSEVTGSASFPDYLLQDVKQGKLNVFSNGEIIYQIKGVWAKISVEWKYKAPPGGGDTHYSVMHGTKCDLIIRQDKEQSYIPELYIENLRGTTMDEFSTKLRKVLATLPYDSLDFKRTDNNIIKITFPKKYRVGHEEHFGQVMAKFLEYMKAGKLPQWELAGMITKYYTTTTALKKAKGDQ
jgi:predicted dehydrogenase